MPSASRQPLAAARAAAALTGRFRPPGDKSVSHRALILGAMAIGETAITGLLEAEDVLHTAKAVAALGAEVAHDGPGRWRVHGVGTGGFAEPGAVIDCGNSGTGVRLLMGAVATTPISVTFTGDASLCRRPMGRVLTPLALFGATALGREGGRLPLTLRGAGQAVPVRYILPVPSAQVKSAVLLAGLAAPGVTTVVEPEATRDHTERMVRAFGGTVRSESIAEGLAISITGEVELKPATIQVPSDPSSAAFPLVAALLVPGSSVTAEGVMLNPTRTGLFATLREMGANLTVSAEREQGGEQVGDVTATFTGALKGIDVPPERAPSMIDEYPILAVLAAFAEGRTVLRGLSELRVKESDRLSAIARGLAVNGVSVTEQEDSLIIEGRGAEGVPGGGVVATAMDHRIAMSFLVMGLAAQKPVEIDDAAFIATSFPEFVTLMERLGASFRRLNR